MLGTLLLLAACADDFDKPCDIRKDDCQQLLWERAKEMRGGEGPMPSIRMMTPEEYLEELTQVDSSDADTAELERLYARWIRALSFFGLAVAEQTHEEAQVTRLDAFAAFYSFSKKHVTILNRGQTQSDAYSNIILIHEFIHRLQDLEVDLANFHKVHIGSMDESIASASIIEGEATLYQNQFAASLLGSGFAHVDWEERQNEVWSSAQIDDNAWLSARAAVPYQFGGEYVADAYAQGGHARILELFTNPPASERQLFAGFDQEKPSVGGKWTEDLDPLGAPDLPDTYQLQFYDSLGVWLFRIFASRHTESEEDWQEGPQDFRELVADRIFVLSNDKDRVVAVWVLRWPNKAWAMRVADALDNGSDNHDIVVIQNDPDVMLVQADDRELLMTLARDGLTFDDLPDDSESRSRFGRIRPSDRASRHSICRQ